MKADCGHEIDRKYHVDADGVSRCSSCSKDRDERLARESVERIRESNRRFAERDPRMDPTMIDNVNRR